MTQRILSLVIPCYKPSETSVQVAEILNEIVSYYVDELELIYLWNGLSDGSAEFRNQINGKLNKQKNCKLLELKENIGVAAGYKLLCEAATSKYIYCLTADDLIDIKNIKEVIQFLKTNDVDFLHQLLNDSTYDESEVLTKVFKKSDPMYNTALGYVAYRYGAITGCIFSKEIFSRVERNWSEKIYPWPEIVLTPVMKSFAIYSPDARIKIDPGRPVHLRFNDKVKRPLDYGFNERIGYADLLPTPSRNIYKYLLIRWIGKIFRSLNNHDRVLAKLMLEKLNYPIKNKRVKRLIFLTGLEAFCTKDSIVGGVTWLVDTRRDKMS